jgi:uncharacterized protein (TIGR00255 family)
MTGFGAAEGEVAGRRIRCEIRTVNHRHFNLAARLPSELSAVEGELREALRQSFERGHLAVSVRWVEDAAQAAGIDWVRATAVVEALRSLRDRFALAGDVTVEMVARQADLFGVRREGEGEAIAWSLLAPVVAAAAADCRASRSREGEVLGTEIRQRVASLRAASDRIEALAPARLMRERDRLRGNVSLLLDGIAVDEQRVAQEIALLADRVDITEELVRLRAHLDATEAALDDDQAVGKRLGFLAQELGREVNTIGSKANDAVIAHEVVGMKGELEKIREQLENLE